MSSSCGEHPANRPGQEIQHADVVDQSHEVRPDLEANGGPGKPVDLRKGSLHVTDGAWLPRQGRAAIPRRVIGLREDPIEWDPCDLGGMRHARGVD